MAKVHMRSRVSSLARLAMVGLLAVVAMLLPAGAGAGELQATEGAPPGFVYETVFNGGWLDSGREIAVDAAGNAYVMARVFDTNNDVLVLKVDPAGNVVWTRFIRGQSLDFGTGIAADNAGGVYITGWTDSSDWPVVNALQATLNGPRDAFLTRLSAADGSILYSTFLGGSRAEGANDLVVNAAGEVYLVGYTDSTDLPTVNPFQAELNRTYCNCDDAFVAKISADGQQLLYGSYFGGAFDDFGESIGVDSDGNIYIAGNTKSDDLPLASPIQATYAGGDRDGFVARIAAGGGTLQYGTYLGGEDWDLVARLVVDGAGNAYVTGSTRSAAFPTTPGAFQQQFAGGLAACGSPPYDPLRNCEDAFVTKVQPDGSAWAYSTFLGGDRVDEARAIAVDAAGRVHLAGYSSSADFPPAGSVTPTDIFVSQLSADGSALNYTLGIGSGSANAGHGIAVGSTGDVYVTGAKNVPADVYVARLGQAGPPPPPPPPQSPTLHVDDIVLESVERVRISRLHALVTIRDGEGQPVAGVEVTSGIARPDGKAQELVSTTDAQGQAEFRARSKAGGAWELCVLDVTRDGYTYDPTQNREDCDRTVVISDKDTGDGPAAP